MLDVEDAVERLRPSPWGWGVGLPEEVCGVFRSSDLGLPFLGDFTRGRDWLRWSRVWAEWREDSLWRLWELSDVG